MQFMCAVYILQLGIMSAITKMETNARNEDYVGYASVSIENL